MREATLHAKKNKLRGISAEIIEKVTQVSLLIFHCGLRTLTFITEEPNEVQMLGLGCTKVWASRGTFGEVE